MAFSAYMYLKKTALIWEVRVMRWLLIKTAHLFGWDENLQKLVRDANILERELVDLRNNYELE